MKMNVLHPFTAAAVLFSALTLSSCATAVKIDPPTRGGRLMDLENSRHSGSVTQAEYQKQRAEILAPSVP
ncbi:MAG: hypothetical protein JWO82_960 [Akkermansiaceae bacterium]|nr:hypothetical protein [Akkermansiaceae bacterium]